MSIILFLNGPAKNAVREREREINNVNSWIWVVGIGVFTVLLFWILKFFIVKTLYFFYPDVLPTHHVKPSICSLSEDPFDEYSLPYVSK